MQYFICFQRKHVDTGEVLTDNDNCYCWTFTDPVLFKQELERLQNPKMDHIHVVGHGMTVQKPD